MTSPNRSSKVPRKAPSRFSNFVAEFLNSEAAGGIVLMACAALALLVANSRLADTYFHTLHVEVGGLSVLHWINDALMALFFLLVGLEIKREFLGGELSTWKQRALPAFAALGGMVVPALVYVAFNTQTPETLKGWAIPAATDIAFALGILSLLGKRVPPSLKIFLAALAIMDDLGAVIIIAIFYTAQLDVMMLGGVAIVTLVLVIMNIAGVKMLSPYLALGALLWYFMHASGVHATLAGVVLALTIPITKTETSPLHILEHGLHKWVAFLIVPIFGFANAGVSLAGVSFEKLLDPVTLGVAAGLFAGKQLGVFASTWLAIRSGLAIMPAGANWAQIYAVAIICGVGFTMSLFIGLLAFPGSEALGDAVKIGVLLGSVLSGVLGAAVLVVAGRK
jgi:Na+:H+ antiporter, NhaA family